jgi:hydroxyacylglutathione hydrolase
VATEDFRQQTPDLALLDRQETSATRRRQPLLVRLLRQGASSSTRRCQIHGTIIAMFSVSAIPAFQDNYLWLLADGGHAVVVDPGDARPVQAFLDANRLVLDAILVTHHHLDHTAGISTLLKSWPVPVYGPRQEAHKIPGLTQLLDDGDTVDLLGQRFEVMALPGHTLGHIAYYCRTPEPLLFCGDTLFSAGCGRLFEGTPQQMHDSLARIAALPDDTRVYCTHEYTLSNLAFAQAVEPANADVAAHVATVQSLRSQQQPSLPTTLALERRINPFLRVLQAGLLPDRLEGADLSAADAVQRFAALRRWKDGFKAA